MVMPRTQQAARLVALSYHLDIQVDTPWNERLNSKRMDLGHVKGSRAFSQAGSRAVDDERPGGGGWRIAVQLALKLRGSRSYPLPFPASIRARISRDFGEEGGYPSSGWGVGSCRIGVEQFLPLTEHSVTELDSVNQAQEVAFAGAGPAGLARSLNLQSAQARSGASTARLASAGR